MYEFCVFAAREGLGLTVMFLLSEYPSCRSGVNLTMFQPRNKHFSGSLTAPVGLMPNLQNNLRLCKGDGGAKKDSLLIGPPFGPIGPFSPQGGQDIASPKHQQKVLLDRYLA